MRFSASYPEVMELNETFHCKARRKTLALDKCLNDYLESNAFDRKSSACFRCPQGRKNREAFADGQGAGDT